MNGWQQALRIIHVSDPHFASRNAWQQRKKLNPLNNIIPVIGMTGGVMGHDGAAFEYFRRSAEPLVTGQSKWPITLLVMTGDLTTWGDFPSVQTGLNLWSSLGSRLQADHTVILYGNHDVWDNDFPLWSAQGALDAHRTQLRQMPPLNGNWPVRHVTTGTNVPFEVWSLNTVLHGQGENAVALGNVAEDRYWEPVPLPDQLADLTNQGTSSGRIRLVLCHHPVAGGLPFFLPFMTLRNAPSVAASLGAQNANAPHWPLAFLILSGHTHETYPKALGLSQRYPPGKLGPFPLGTRQIQLTTGTVAQTYYSTTRDPIKLDKRQNWQLLDLWLDAQGQQLAVERRVFRRDEHNAGPFKETTAAEYVTIPL